MNRMLYLILLLLILCGACSSPPNPPPSPSHEKPRILFTNFHNSHSGGHRSFILSLATSPLNQEYEFAVAVPETSDIYNMSKALGIKTYPCNFPGILSLSMISASSRFRKIVRDFSPDIIHTNGARDRTVAVWNTLFMSQRPKIIQMFHNEKMISKDPYHQWLHNSLIDAHVFVADSSYKLYQENEGLPLNSAYVIPNGVDIEKFRPREKDVLLRKQLGIPEDVFIFGSQAGLSEYKRIDLLLEALTRFPKNAPFRVLLVGKHFEGWKEKAKSMGVDHFLCFTGFQSNVIPYCSLFDVGFVLSTKIETCSFAAREMMSMGIPLISSSFSGLKDNVDNHINGVLIETGNAEEVYQAMQFFLQMPVEELSNYRNQARLKSVQSFNAQEQYVSISALYQKLLGHND
jgi:glycosyltransferase involved in cell wall biosynthesis